MQKMSWYHYSKNCYSLKQEWLAINPVLAGIFGIKDKWSFILRWCHRVTLNSHSWNDMQNFFDENFKFGLVSVWRLLSETPQKSKFCFCHIQGWQNSIRYIIFILTVSILIIFYAELMQVVTLCWSCNRASKAVVWFKNCFWMIQII